MDPTEHHCRVCSACASYSEGPGLKFQLAGRVHCARAFVKFLSFSRQMPAQYFKSDHDRFLPHSVQWTDHPILRRYYTLVH